MLKGMDMGEIREETKGEKSEYLYLDLTILILEIGLFVFCLMQLPQD